MYYFIGALVFEAVPPFKIKKISKEPIISKGMFSCAKEVPHLRNNWIVSYPTGLAVERNQAIVSIGVNDSCMKIVSIDLNKLLSSMRSVP